MSVIIFVEIACFIIAVTCLIKDADFTWRSMVLFLLITCITEITGKLLKVAHRHNTLVYNIFLIFEASFTSLMFNRILGKYINSRPLILSVLILLLLLYIYEIFNHGFFVFNDIMATVMSVVL
jgi:hypothetical protein